ncbi:hypothetical protein [Nonomuraea dietziae]|uniref:hypothetical protein n=1 Tax=Nonomuraea dietziae TaxID=65515 RepID=UPI0033EE22F8
MSLFPLPLVLPHHTHYARLGVGPEATAEEIRAAAARLAARLKARNAGVQEMVEAHATDYLLLLDSPRRGLQGGGLVGAAGAGRGGGGAGRGRQARGRGGRRRDGQMGHQAPWRHGPCPKAGTDFAGRSADEAARARIGEILSRLR